MTAKPETVEFLFFPISICSDSENNKSVVKLSGVTDTGRKVCLVDDTYKPYFYAIISPDADISAVKSAIETTIVRSETVDARVDSVKLDTVSLLSKQVKVAQVFVNISSDISPLRKAVSYVKGITSIEEYDIPLCEAYTANKNISFLETYKVRGEIIVQDASETTIKLSDIKYVNSDNPPLKILAFDIETLCAGYFPDPRIDSIISIALYSDNYERVITWKKFNDAPSHITFVDSELELIKEFCRLLKHSSPHILVGYNSSVFDLPFIKSRAEKYGIDFDMSQIGLISDVLLFVRNLINLQTSNYKLDAVAKELLHTGKQTLDASKMTELWSIGLREDLQRITDYNLTDAKLTFDLFCLVYPIELELSKLTGQPLAEIHRATYGLLVEWFLIKNAHRFKQLIPKHPHGQVLSTRASDTYEGGYVLPPDAGLYKNIYLFDFKSLYPSIIISHNIGPDTINCKCCTALTCAKSNSFFATLIKELIDRRKQVNNVLKHTDKTDKSYSLLNARQYALKTIANASYGYLGYANSRWYCLECAKAVTNLGRDYIKAAAEIVTKSRFKVIYGDTDSLFITSDKPLKDISSLVAKINTKLPEHMELSYEGHYTTGLFFGHKGEARGAKKRYALLSDSGAIILKGVEAIRGDWSQLAKELQRKVIEIILREGNVPKAVQCTRDVIQSIRSGNVDKSDLIISVKLVKPVERYAINAPYVAAAKKYLASGYKLRKGFTVQYIITKGDSRISDRAIPALDASATEYDAEYYIDHQVMRAVYKIFEIFGLSEDEVRSGQKTLASW